MASTWDGIDWAATGTWAQFFAAILAVWAAVTISGAQRNAAKIVAADERKAFADLIYGVCQAAATDIVEAAETLLDHGNVLAIAVGLVPRPSTVSHVHVIAALDFNRMPSAAAALEVAEMRRMAGRTKSLCDSAIASAAEHGAIHPELAISLRDWRDSAVAGAEALRMRLGMPEAH